jgi:hypothetical protein
MDDKLHISIPFSTDYRNAFNEHLRPLKKTIFLRWKFETSNAVGQQHGQTYGWPVAANVQMHPNLERISARSSRNLAQVNG